MVAFTTWVASAKAYIYFLPADTTPSYYPADRLPTYTTPASLAAQSVTDTELQVVTMGQSDHPALKLSLLYVVGTITLQASEEEVAPEADASAGYSRGVEEKDLPKGTRRASSILKSQ